MNPDRMHEFLTRQPEHPLLEQEAGEPIDFFAMRAFVVAMRRAHPGAARAMYRWMVSKGDAMLSGRDGDARDE